MPQNPVIRQLSLRDLQILYDLYQYRVLTTEQIKKRYFANSKSYVNQKLHAMRNSHLITTFPVSRGNGKRGMACHRLTDTGIACLKEQGMPVKYRASDLQVTPGAIPYLLAANDIMIELTPYGWTMRDSRETKALYNLNRGDIIHGTLISPDGTEYGLYVLMAGTFEHNMAKIIQEIRATSMGEAGLTNFMIFTKGAASFSHFIERATEPKVNPAKPFEDAQPLIVGGALCVLPYRFGIQYLKAISIDNDLVKFFTRYGSVTPIQNRTPFKWLIRHNGDEKYLVNLLDTDLMKIHDLKRYLTHQYQEDGHRVLIMTHMRDKHEELLDGAFGIDFQEIDPKEIEAIEWGGWEQ